MNNYGTRVGVVSVAGAPHGCEDLRSELATACTERILAQGKERGGSVLLYVTDE